jgi:hypothetical protein
MKAKLSIVSLLLISIIACKSKEDKKRPSLFTGTINYVYTYSSDSLNADSLARTRTTQSFFRYDENDYQSQFIASDTETYFYSGAMNKCASKKGSPAAYGCEDYGILTDSVLSTVVYETDEKVLGYNCKVLEMQKKNSWVKYYISTDLKIAPATYQKHRSYNWDVYGEKAEGGLILKSEHRFKLFSMSGIATGLKEYDKGFKALEMDKKTMDSLCLTQN